jgi:hypothetical protein
MLAVMSSTPQLQAELAPDHGILARKRWVPGLITVSSGWRPPYPMTVYALEGDDSSGIVGSIQPDGTFTPYQPNPSPRPVRYWDDDLARFVTGTCVWDGSQTGSVELGAESTDPHRRLFDTSLLGEWPLHPPRPAKLVNPEKARLAGEEKEAA